MKNNNKYKIEKILRHPYKSFNKWFLLVKYINSDNIVQSINLTFNSKEEALAIKVGDMIEI